MGKLLQIAGVMAILGFTAAGVAAWLLTKEQIHVTIEPGAGAERATGDPVALLSERIAVLEQDVRALAGALGENLQQLDSSLETAAADRHRENALAIRRVEDRLTATSSASAADVRAMRDEVSALRAAVTALADRGEEWAHVETPPLVREDAAPPPATAMAGEEPAVEIGSDGDAAAAAPTPESEREPAATSKRSFLAFRLPSDDFSFDGRRRWEVVPSLSRVGFDAKSTLHDFTGATKDVRATLIVDLAHPDQAPEGTIHVGAASLDTGLADRNTAMCEHLGAKQHPEITFTWNAFSAEGVDVAAMRVAGTARGTMSIHGVSRPVEMPVTMCVDDARRLTIEGETRLPMSDYEIEIPSKLGLISVEDEVKVWIALRARPLAREAN